MRTLEAQEDEGFPVFTKDKYNASNIQPHMLNQHPIKLKKYIEARDNKEMGHNLFEAFFEQSKLQTLHFESQGVNGQHVYSIGKDIVEVAVKELLIDSQEKLNGDSAMRAPEP